MSKNLAFGYWTLDILLEIRNWELEIYLEFGTYNL